MAVKRVRWQKAAGVGVLTLIAGLAGYKSEVLAQQGNSQKYTSKGQQMDVHATGFAPNPSGWVSSGVDVTVSSNVTGPGQPTPTTTMWLNATIDTSWDNGTRQSLSGGGNIPSKALNVKVSGNGASGVLNATGDATLTTTTYDSWGWQIGWTSQPVQASVNAQLSSDQVYVEMSRNQYHTRLMGGPGGPNQTLHSDFNKSQSAVNPQGTLGVSYNDGVTTTSFVPQGTAAWGNVRDVSAGFQNVYPN